jgi:hypothetical protein
MPRVVPSQVVGIIEKVFPHVVKSPTTADGIGGDYAATLQAIANLAKNIPDELITLGGEDYVDYVAALGAIDQTLLRWLHRGPTDTLSTPWRRGLSTIALLHFALKKCPDEAAALTTAELNFIQDVDLQASIRRDISAANRDLVNGSWKGATVLAAGASEALLLWALQHKQTSRAGAARTPPSDVASAGARCAASRILGAVPPPDPEHWIMHQYIEVTLQLDLIHGDTAAQLRLAKDFRNLIHPGRALRLATTCDRGTALAAIAGVELVVRDLS